MKYLFMLISFIVSISYTNPIKAQFLPPISFNNFFKIASEGDLQGLKDAQRRGLNINSINSNGDTAVCVAIKQKNYLAYRTLLRAGAKPNHNCVEKIPEYSHKAFLNNYNKQYGAKKAYLSPNKKWQSFLIGAGIAGGVGAALSGGGGGGGSSESSDVAPPSFDTSDGKDKCELNKCAEGCYTDLTCQTGYDCGYYNNCGGCESCVPHDTCKNNECAAGCFENVTCSPGFKCAERNNCNGCNRCEEIAECRLTPCKKGCYADRSCPVGQECIKKNDCGGCEACALLDSCDVVVETSYNPISHFCSKYFLTCPKKCQEITENPSFEINSNFEKCSDGYEINGKCYKKETIKTPIDCKNFESCKNGYFDEDTGLCYECEKNAEVPCNINIETCADEFFDDVNQDGKWNTGETCHKCILRNDIEVDKCNEKFETCATDFTYTIDRGQGVTEDVCYKCIPSKESCKIEAYQKCEDGYLDEDTGLCYSCVNINESQTCAKYQTCQIGYYEDTNNNAQWDNGETCYNCINNTSKICDLAKWQKCEDGYEDADGNCYKCIANPSLSSCTIDSNTTCEDGYFDEDTGLCYSCINTEYSTNNNERNSYNAFSKITLPIKNDENEVSEEFYTLYRAIKQGENESSSSYEETKNMDAYNSRDANTGHLSLSSPDSSSIALFSYQNAYNSASYKIASEGKISIYPKKAGYYIGIYATKNAYNSYSLNNSLSANGSIFIQINIGTETDIDMHIYGIYSHEGSNSYNAYGGTGMIQIYTDVPVSEIYGIYNGNMSANNGEGTIIINDSGTPKIYGIYDGNMSGVNDTITINTKRNGLTQTIVGIHKNDSEITKGKISIQSDRTTYMSDSVIGIEYNGEKTFNASENSIEITGGLHTSTGLISSSQNTQASKIDITTTNTGVNSIYGIKNTLKNLDSAQLILNDIKINNKIAGITNILGVETNNPNININENTTISIKHTNTTNDKSQDIYGIKYTNYNENKKLIISTSGTEENKGKININLDAANPNLKVYGIYINGSSEFTVDSKNMVPITIGNEQSGYNENFYGLYLDNDSEDDKLLDLSKTEYFTNEGTISSEGYGISINNAKINNKATITSTLDGIKASNGYIKNSNVIQSNTIGINAIDTEIDNSGNMTNIPISILAEGGTITNSGTLTFNNPDIDVDVYGIKAKNTEINNSGAINLTAKSTVSNTYGNIIYGIYAEGGFLNNDATISMVSSQFDQTSSPLPIGIYADGTTMSNIGKIEVLENNDAPYSYATGILAKDTTFNNSSGEIDMNVNSGIGASITGSSGNITLNINLTDKNDNNNSDQSSTIEGLIVEESTNLTINGTINVEGTSQLGSNPISGTNELIGMIGGSKNNNTTNKASITVREVNTDNEKTGIATGLMVYENEKFTNEGVINISSNLGTAIGIKILDNIGYNSSFTNTGNITASAPSSETSYGIYATSYASIVNTANISAEYGIYGYGVRNINNSGAITSNPYGIIMKKSKAVTEVDIEYTLQNSGAIELETTQNSIGRGLYLENIKSVQNSGDISGGYYGIDAFSIGNLTNSGSITTQKKGITVRDSFESISHENGVIQADEIGILAYDGVTNSTINIEGSIGGEKSPVVGIYSNGIQSIIVNESGTINAGNIGIYTDGGNVTNSGTINVSGSGTEMYGILGLNSNYETSNTPTTIINSGTINVTNSYTGSDDIKAFGIYAGTGVNVENRGTIDVKSTGESIGSNSWVGGIYLAQGSTLNNSGTISINKKDSDGKMYGIITASKLPLLSNQWLSNDGNLIDNPGTIKIGEKEYEKAGTITQEQVNNWTKGQAPQNLTVDSTVFKYGLNDGAGNSLSNILYIDYNNEIGMAYLVYNDIHITPFVSNLILEQTEIASIQTDALEKLVDISLPPALEEEITSLIQAQGASISTTGLFETDMPLTLSTLGLRKFGVGKNGTIEAPSISGEVTAETSIVDDGFETTYTNEESFIGDTSGVNIVSESALFNAKLVEKDNNTTDIVMTMKPFEEVVENESVAEYLQRNYADKNNEQLFSELKSYGTNSEINSHLNKELGLSLLPNFAQENLQIFKSLNGLIIDDMFSKNLTDERMLVGYDYMSQDRNSKGHITGYDNHANSSYFLADIKLDKNSRFGAGMSITKFDSDYDDNSSRDETFVSALASYMYEFNPNLKYAGVARLGYGFGDYDRNTSDNSYKANLHDVVYGLGNQLRYTYDMKYFTIEPQFEFNVSGYYQRNMKEQIKNNSLRVASTNNLSVETGVGLYASKSAKFNEWTNLKARLGAGYYRELADPYHDMKVSLRGMNGFYKTDASPIFDRDRYLLNADINLDWKQFNFYMRANWFIENNDTAVINAGIKYNF